MQCPWCKNEMTPGHLHFGRGGRPRWTKEGAELFLDIQAVEGELIGKPRLGKVFCHRCDACMKIVIDIADEENY